MLGCGCQRQTRRRNLSEHGPATGPGPASTTRSPAPGRAAVLPQQAALRRPGHLPAPPVPRAGRARPPRRGLLRPALPRARAGPAAAHGAQPGPVPRARPVPHAAAARVPRLDRRAGVRRHVDRRVPRAADVQPAGARGCCGPAAPTSTSCTTTRCWATACSASPGWACRWSPASTTRSAWTGGSSWPRPGACPGCPSAAGTRFVRMQARVARRVRPDPDRVASPPATTSAATSGSRPRACGSSRSGVDTRLFHPRPRPACPAAIVAVASADSPVKGVATLLRAFGQARHRTRRAADRGRQAGARRPDRAARRRAGPGRPGAGSSTASATPSWPS